MKMTEEQRRLAAEAAPLAQKIARGYTKVYPRLADELSEAADKGAICAARTFGPFGGKCWNKWVKHNVRWAINNRLAKIKIKKSKSLEAPWGLCDPVSRESRADVSAESENLVASLLVHLECQQRDMVRKMYWEGKSTAEVAVETGITQRRCQQILFSALDVMRRHVEA